MTNTPGPLTELSDITKQLDKLEAKAGPLRKRATALVIAALKAGTPPSKVVAASPFSPAHIRNLARAAGIAPAKRGGAR